ncbi:MAG TPA: hypothetical protein VGO93_18640 [Candidatus Xenobia bacterium]
MKKAVMLALAALLMAAPGQAQVAAPVSDDGFFVHHRALYRELAAQPSLLQSAPFLSDHAGLRQFLADHPGWATQFLAEHPGTAETVPNPYNDPTAVGAPTAGSYFGGGGGYGYYGYRQALYTQQMTGSAVPGAPAAGLTVYGTLPNTPALSNSPTTTGLPAPALSPTTAPGTTSGSALQHYLQTHQQEILQRQQQPALSTTPKAPRRKRSGLKVPHPKAKAAEKKKG